MLKNLCSGVGARKELAEFVKQNGVKQYECGSGRPRDLLNYVVKNEVAAFDVTEKMGVYDGGNNLCSAKSSGEGEVRNELAEFVKQNGVKQYECTMCGKAYLTENSFSVHVSRKHRGLGRPRDLLN